MSERIKDLDRFGAWRHLLDATVAEASAESALPSIRAHQWPAPEPAKPKVHILGYWEGASGSMLRFQKGSSENAVTVTGTALDQRVQGTGSIEGDRLTLRLTLQVKRTELTLDLAMPGGTHELQADRMIGIASDAKGTRRSLHLSRKGADLQGTWRQSNASSLTFAEPVFDWFDGEQTVRMDVSGYIFGRAGEGTLKSLGRNVTGVLKALDYSHHNRHCPKEGWWAAEHLHVSLEMCPDGSFLTGRVKPLGRADYASHKIEEHVHLTRSAGGSAGRAPRSYL